MSRSPQKATVKTDTMLTRYAFTNAALYIYTCILILISYLIMNNTCILLVVSDNARNVVSSRKITALLRECEYEYISSAI